MVEYIKRADAISAVCVGCSLYSEDEPCGCAEKEEILAIPIADVVEVVRCKDCVFLGRNEDGNIKCHNTYGLLIITENEYCSRGRKREK